MPLSTPRPRRNRVDSTDTADLVRLREAILDLLNRRDRGNTICPSDAARAVAGNTFRPLMPAARAAAAELASENLLEVTQRGDPVDPLTARGPIRLRLR